MRRQIFCLSLLISLPALINAGAGVDFDGGRTNDRGPDGIMAGTITAGVDLSSSALPHLMSKLESAIGSSEQMENELIAEKLLPHPYAPYIGDTGLVVRREICNSEGKCDAVEPAVDLARQGFDRQDYNFAPGNITRRSLSCTKGKWTAQISYSFSAIVEGHDHSEALFPPLAVHISTNATLPANFQETPSPVVFPEMQKNTTYYYWERLPIFAATIEEKLTTTGACAGSRTDSIHVGFQDMIPLPPAGQWYHPSHHPSPEGYAHINTKYGTPKLINATKAISKEYIEALPDASVLYIYDMSLPYGGIIDINRNWKRPFYGHSTGIDADISKWRVPPENREKLLEIMCKHADTYSEQDVPGQPPYFHIRVADTFNLGADNFERAPKTTIKCCSGTSVNPAVLDVCISTQTNTR